MLVTDEVESRRLIDKKKKKRNQLEAKVGSTSTVRNEKKRKRANRTIYSAYRSATSGALTDWKSD